ncbi:hypothetical protein CH298_02765 [Rhodococcoides fascians]|uniref:DUF3039 domain-containing protein n=1 Tax=Rhodococcoides fascians TaxID=1828 RepID=UPI000B9AC8A0|nr:DUF3039 domain-containing protein [Rhodococcus fascians]OZE92474.1 hypothetical protein CH303_02765 [Rhodococcus fascians]OZF23107.1 hypothetical protein CH298_02765 [Rhodococcus fascians]OZF24821.1 hypothetical protein CH297_02765 [Rhodococcus fascians]OZF72416.1 hypothetical protein CH308_02770 [Rhodococcus fascians]OZF73714.1 hypothetical protein CH307_02765 [Rhodococcus fascians]
MTTQETNNTAGHGTAIPNVTGGADGTKSPEKEPVVTMIGQTNPDDQSELLHYVKKGAILRSIVDGVDAVALCGDQFLAYPPPSGSGIGHAQICPACSEIYAGLPAGRKEAVNA